MSDTIKRLMAQIRAKGEQRSMTASFQECLQATPDALPEPETLPAGVVATVQALEAFKRVLTEHNVPPDTYPLIAGSIMTDGFRGLHPEEVRALADRAAEQVHANRAPTTRATSYRIELEDNDPDYPPTLLCPHCDGNYLHHSSVTMYDRSEDAEMLTKTGVMAGVSTSQIVPSAGSGNPSARRDGLAIRFWCELCTATDIELTIEQHKGCTYLGWRYSIA